MSEQISEIERALVALGRPLPPSLVKQRDGPRIKGTDRYIQLDYVEWHVIADMLNKLVPGWDFEIDSVVETKAGDFAIAGTLTIAGVRRSNVGTSDKDGANGPKVAASDCLKRCATLFGLGLDLYRNDEQNRWAVRRLDDAAARIAEADADSTRPADPVARVLTDLVTPKQLVAIRAIGSAAGVDAEKRSLEMFNARPEELTKKAASALIDDIKAERATTDEIEATPPAATPPVREADEIVEEIKREFGGVELLADDEVELLRKELKSVGRTIEAACNYYGVAEPRQLTSEQGDELIGLVRKAREKNAQAASQRG